MEGIKERILSGEEQEKKEKIEEFSNVMSLIRDSIDKFNPPSDEAQEIGTSMNDFIKEFEAEGLKLEDYSLGRVLLYKENAINELDLPLDTKKGLIEKKIKELKEEQEKRLSYEKVTA